MLMPFAAACSTAPDGQPAPPTGSASAVAAPVLSATTAPAAASGTESSEQQTRSPVGETAGPRGPSRTADAAGPFGQPDLWIGAGPPTVGLQRSLGPGDLPGPLLDAHLASPGVFRVYDMCGYTETSFREGGDFASVVYRFGRDTARRFHKGCSQSRFMAVANSRWIDNERSYFRWRNQAEAWLAERQSEHYGASAAARSNGSRLPGNVRAIGFADSLRQGNSGPFGVEFSSADAPLDEVRVLAETVAVADGVLRGLVRNWSRHLWAYGVTVNSSGHGFVWPLSIQPGEIAPFEIYGWDGPTDPSEIRFAVTADMSWHTDPSRALDRRSSGVSRLWVGALARRTMPSAVRDRYRHVTADTALGSISEGTISWEVAPIEGPPGSHPSLADDLETLVIEDLRAYGAVFDRAGRVVEVGPAEILDTGGWSPFDELFDVGTSPTEISALNGSEDLRTQLMSVRFDVHKERAAADISRAEWPEGGLTSPADFYERDGYDARGVVEGGFILWIGAAHPTSAVS